MDLEETCQKRFIAYCEIDSGSDTARADAGIIPSTDAQMRFAEILLREALAMGYEAAIMPFGLLIRAHATQEGIEPYLLGAHIDTTEEAANRNVKVMSHPNYDGRDITLPSGNKISMNKFPALRHHIGDTIFTSDGTTLLGGDDKSGVAALMTFLEYLALENVAHGDISVALTFDEETGLYGAYKLDPKEHGIDAKFGFTFDSGYAGMSLPSLGIETFNAAKAMLPIPEKDLEKKLYGKKAKITISGIPSFPGHAKKDGAIDPFRTLPEVYEYLLENNISIASIDKNHETGDLELEVLLQDGQSLEGLKEIKDYRFQDLRQNNPVKYILGDSAELGKAIDIAPVVQLIRGIPYEMSAEQTDGRQGYMLPVFFLTIQDGKKVLETVLRDFTEEGLAEKKALAGKIAPSAAVTDEYQNMGNILRQHPYVVEIARKAMQISGLNEIEDEVTRGGNEAAAYTLRAGIPSVNVNALGEGCHTTSEWLGARTLIAALYTAIHINEQVVLGMYR